MKSPFYLRSFALVLSSAALVLSGCGGVNVTFPDSVATSQAKGPAVEGSLYGGHAPIVGAHVYLAQPGTFGIGSRATSILGNNGATNANGYPLTANVSDPYVTVGAQYVTSDSSGGFSFTGAYTCAIGQPVFTYSYGGIASGTPVGTPSTYSITTIVVSNLTGNGSNGKATYTVTTNTPDSIVQNQTVTLSGLTGSFTVINTSQTVLTTPSTTSFSFQGFDPTGSGNIAAGTYTTTNFGTAGIVSAAPQPNNSIVNMATLGNCPSSGNFSTAGNGKISYIYMNEVSTVTTAYTFQPFTLAANDNAWDIGSSGTTQGLIGIENAAATAAQLYDIQGSQISTSFDGEGHIANYQTLSNGIPNQGNGVVPQATIDTLGNILAACVDSGSTSSALSAQCSTLFANATADGTTTGPRPTDIAAAAMNIARYPAGNHSVAGGTNASFVGNIYGISSGVVPFTPHLFAQPNDFTIVINYPYTAVPGYPGATNSLLNRAESVAVDNIGQLWITAQTTGSVVRWSPLGQQNSQHFSPGGYIYGYVSIDGANNAWAGNANSTTGIEEFGSNGVLAATYGSGYKVAYAVFTTSAGNAYFVANTANTAGNYQLFEYGPGGATIPGSPFSISPSSIVAGKDAVHGAVDASGDIWLTAENGSNQIARVTSTGVAVFPSITTQQAPEFPSIDGSGNAWIAIQAIPAQIYIVSPTGGTTVLTSASTGATLNSTFGSAVDGNGNVWFTNRCGNYGSCTLPQGANSIIEINGANHLAISPPSNYIPTAQYPASQNSVQTILNDSLNMAIDPSGNIWVTNYTGNSVAELVGIAAPVVTPLSNAAGNNALGRTP